MGKAKEIIIRPITQRAAAKCIKENHYSGKVCVGSQLHFGVFIGPHLFGAMQFGPSMDKRKMAGLVEGTGWNDFIELNRMAFSKDLPRNSESRALSVAFKIMRKAYPHIKWCVTFADGTQCGDGTIYRAAGFLLCGIKENKTMLKGPNGVVVADKTLNNSKDGRKASFYKKALGFRPIPGFQFRYIYFLDRDQISNLTVPILPYSTISACGGGMYLGKKRAGSSAIAAPGHHPGEGGASPTPALHFKEQPNG